MIGDRRKHPRERMGGDGLEVQDDWLQRSREPAEAHFRRLLGTGRPRASLPDAGGSE